MAARREDAKIPAMSSASPVLARLSVQSPVMQRQIYRSER